MAYIPPHKRHSLDSDDRPPSPAPPPSSLLPRFSKALSLSSHKIIYAASSISRWFPSGDFANPSLRLEPVDRKFGANYLVLNGCGDVDPEEQCPWVSIAEKIESDLVAAARSAREELESETERVRLSFLARIGKVFFHSSSVSLESIRKAAAAESNSRNQVRKTFNTSLPIEYMEEMQRNVVPRIGLEFDSEKEQYYVMVHDKNQPDSNIACKCTVGNGGELEIRKIELRDVRHLVVDVSCLHKDLDLRLMLLVKRILKFANDEEQSGLNKLIKSAIVDPDVKGGLRWPLGKESLVERFSVVGIWHTTVKAFSGQSMKLRLRHADRYDYKASTGEVSNEVTLKLTGISKLLKEEDINSGSLKEMVQEAVELVCLNFLKI